MDFNFCIFGEPSGEILEWIEYHNLGTEESGKFTNIIIPQEVDMKDLFLEKESFGYMDGFSPNLNKNLHVGHLSNLIIASAFQNLSIAKEPISIMGDTMDGEVDQTETFKSYESICKLFNYKLGDVYYASKMDYDGDLLKDGEGDYKGTKVFQVEDEKIVGIKSNGSTSYFYQDVALASHLDKSTLYMTGFEQNNHFETLGKLFPTVNHIGLGLVMIDSQKMSSRDGNVIFASEIIEKFKNEFEDEKIAINILKGQILKSKPDSVKNISTKNIDNPKTSPGLYLSYTTARLNSAGLVPSQWDSPIIEEFNSQEVEYSFLKAKYNMSPNILLKSLMDLCGKINNLYMNHTIKDNPKNQMMFQPMLDDLNKGMSLLGMNYVEKVKKQD
ncbi:MAG: Arginine--tRNA ligase [uncultured marine phage]|uniref:Arginine--tRNA ligase n=1 Tax=uncultured marine phage TaxID=707152 RepID=A0A8D9CCB2_9VIRU|nr:MAG: Arginine--tRNA ligase [uncultured marine phage]